MIKIALAGQPNCGKSTIFNMLSGLKQHIANYPGVTVDKKSGRFSYEDEEIELIDLPGTYSFSSYSLEERVAKEAILYENPDIIINVIDASNIKRNLYLTFQLLEIGKPLILILNMSDVATRRGISIDANGISKMLNSHVVEAVGAKNIGKDEILRVILFTYNQKRNYDEFRINYEELEPFIEKMQSHIKEFKTPTSHRWLAIKALEGDEVVYDILKSKEIKDFSKKLQNEFEKETKMHTENFLAYTRYASSDVIHHKCVKEKQKDKKTITDKIDSVVLNRWLAFPILFFVIFLVYELSIVYGYKLTDYTWPILAGLKNFVISVLPEPTLAQVPMITDFGIWLVNSANALLNYIPIFFILFALIAIMEDVGYMPRIAFILDRIFRKYGLHGQSTLPLVLGGAFVGGCAVPGVMSTKGIADERAKMATILTVPLMNCLAKVPFYTLLLGAFFPKNISLMMFYISTITMFLALIIAKLVTSTILKTRESAPFVMELPPYHLPTLKGVLFRASERVWMYIKKVVTIVLAVAVILFALLQFPGISSQKEAHFNTQTQKMLSRFDKSVQKGSLYSSINTKEKVTKLLNFYDDYRLQKMISTSKAIDAKFRQKNAEYYRFVRPKTKDARVVNRALRKLSKARNRILRNIKNDKVENSLLGMVGKMIEPISQYAGFDWKINVAFLSSFAARESAVATLGSLYENNKSDRAEVAMAKNSGYTPLHATAIIIFMLLTPPCIATMIVVKMQTNSYAWMSFATFFPITLGVFASACVFTLGKICSLSGLEAMGAYYAFVVSLALLLGFLPQKNINWAGGLIQKIKDKK